MKNDANVRQVIFPSLRLGFFFLGGRGETGDYVRFYFFIYYSNK